MSNFIDHQIGGGQEMSPFELGQLLTTESEQMFHDMNKILIGRHLLSLAGWDQDLGVGRWTPSLLPLMQNQQGCQPIGYKNPTHSLHKKRQIVLRIAQKKYGKISLILNLIIYTTECNRHGWLKYQQHLNNFIIEIFYLIFLFIWRNSSSVFQISILLSCKKNYA